MEMRLTVQVSNEMDDYYLRGLLLDGNTIVG